jgi:hypothetical protein
MIALHAELQDTKSVSAGDAERGVNRTERPLGT